MSKLAKYTKAIAAFVGGLTPAMVLAVLALFGVQPSAETVATVLGGVSPLVSLVATVAAPANKNDETN